MKRKDMIKINGAKLREAFRTRNISIDKAGVEVGYSKQYFRNACDRDIIAMPGVALLKTVYNIPLSEYKEEPEPEYPAHVIVFDKRSVCYEDDPDYNIEFIKRVAMLTEDHLKGDGLVLLADVYRNLGIEYPNNLSYDIGWDDPEKSILFDLLIKKNSVVINCNANGALHPLENRDNLPEVTLKDIYEKLNDIHLALTKIGTSLNARRVAIQMPKRK